ncbi:MAG TPA: hypothetical protein PKD84_10675 [Propionicimonas sp.]|jgi:hypothetical protein|nr:hypothetical protein [Propionicimonas sp.]
MKTDPFAQAGRSTRCGTHRALVAAYVNGVEGADTGVLAGGGATADEFADLQPDREVAR